ncbi:hypothetical protein D9M73_123810 [compost metagenome]
MDAVGQIDAQRALFARYIAAVGLLGRRRGDRPHRHQRRTDRDRPDRRAIAQRIAFAFHQKNRRDHGCGFAHQQIEIEVDQGVARSDSVPGAHMWGEAAPAQPDRVDAEVDQDLRAVIGFDRQRMAGRLHADDAPVARRVQASAGWIDRQPVAQHPPGEHGVGNIVQRSDPAL